MASGSYTAVRTFIIAALFVLAAAIGPARAEMIDGIVAVVDDTVIMYSDLLKKMRDLGAKEYDLSSARQVLQIMVEDAVVEKIYKRMGFQPVDLRHAEQMARDMNIDVASARSLLMKSTLMDLMVKSRVVITDAMVMEYYKKNKGYAGADSVHLKQILIKGDEEKADKAISELKSGKGFDEVAGTYSDILVSGSPDIGWVALVDLAPEVHKVLETAKPGETAGPVLLDGNFLVYEVVERAVTGARPLEEVRGEIVEALQEKYRKEAFEHWLNMIMADHYIGMYL